MVGSDDVDSPLLGLLEEVERRIHLRRRDILGTLRPVEEALARYARALEEAAAVEYAKSHGFARPATAGVSPQQAAESLLAVVAGLPELVGEAGALQEAARVAPVPSNASPSRPEAVADPKAPRSLSEVLPRVARACSTKKLLIVGALSGRKKPLPPPLDQATEWVDTADASRATLGIPQRIKKGALFALIICDQSVSHKHTEPLLAAARTAGLPVGFAGKGGAGAIARALEAIEEQLST